MTLFPVPLIVIASPASATNQSDALFSMRVSNPGWADCDGYSGGQLLSGREYGGVGPVGADGHGECNLSFDPARNTATGWMVEYDPDCTPGAMELELSKDGVNFYSPDLASNDPPPGSTLSVKGSTYQNFLLGVPFRKGGGATFVKPETGLVSARLLLNWTDCNSATLFDWAIYNVPPGYVGAPPGTPQPPGTPGVSATDGTVNAVTGQVVDEHGTPVPEMAMTLSPLIPTQEIGLSPVEPIASAVTSNSGTFKFPLNLVPGGDLVALANSLNGTLNLSIHGYKDGPSATAGFYQTDYDTQVQVQQDQSGTVSAVASGFAPRLVAQSLSRMNLVAAPDPAGPPNTDPHHYPAQPCGNPAVPIPRPIDPPGGRPLTYMTYTHDAGLPIAEVSTSYIPMDVEYGRSASTTVGSAFSYDYRKTFSISGSVKVTNQVSRTATFHVPRGNYNWVASDFRFNDYTTYYCYGTYLHHQVDSMEVIPNGWSGALRFARAGINFRARSSRSQYDAAASRMNVLSMVPGGTAATFTQHGHQYDGEVAVLGINVTVKSDYGSSLKLLWDNRAGTKSAPLFGDTNRPFYAEITRSCDC